MGMEIPLRVVGDVLVWRTDDATVRLESRLGRVRAVALAETIGR